MHETRTCWRIDPVSVGRRRRWRRWPLDEQGKKVLKRRHGKRRRTAPCTCASALRPDGDRGWVDRIEPPVQWREKVIEAAVRGDKDRPDHQYLFAKKLGFADSLSARKTASRNSKVNNDESGRRGTSPRIQTGSAAGRSATPPVAARCRATCVKAGLRRQTCGAKAQRTPRPAKC